MSDSNTNKEAEAKRKQGRSPAYPGIDLEAAVAKARALYDAEGKYAAPMPSAFTAWGFSPKSSGAREVRAALKYFGLITLEGDGETGKVKLTDEALRILLDEREDQSEKKALLRRLALQPAIHKSLWEAFPDGIKSDATVEHHLIFEHGFNKSAASELVSEFKATAQFTELFKPAKDVVKSTVTSEKPEAKIGDLVQIEVNGVVVFGEPKRVRSVQELEGRKWVFVEGSGSGIPMDDIRVVEKAQGDAGVQPAVPTLPLTAAVASAMGLKFSGREEKFSLAEGDVTIRYPEGLSADSVSDLDAYLKVFLKKAQREAGIPKTEPPKQP